MVKDLAELRAVLTMAGADRLLGTAEDTWVDFKKEPYRLDTFKGRWEYSKDVAAMANAHGGCIVIGIKTARPPNALASIAESYTAVPKKLVDQKQYADTLLNGVYPDIWGVSFTWYPPAHDVEGGLLVIEVPPQRPRDKPFILRAMLGPEDKQTTALGIPIRNGSETVWLKAERLHPLLVGALGDRGSESEGPRIKKRAERADEIVETLTRENDWAGIPVLFLQAFPPPGVQVLPDLHSEGGIRGSFETPQSRRSLGFDLRVAGPVTPRDGGLMRTDSRKALWLDRDGLFTAGAVATPAFLGWAMGRRDQITGPFDLNATALVEFAYEFFRFLHGVLAPKAGRGPWTFRVLLRGWRSLSGGVRLAPGPNDPYRQATSQLASGDQLDDEFVGSDSPERDAFTVLERIYGLFGLPASAIPYARDSAVADDLVPKS